MPVAPPDQLAVLVCRRAAGSALPDCHSPAISGLEPNVYVAWQCAEKGEVYSDIHFSFSEDRGANWSGSQKLTIAEAESVFPRIVVSDEITWFFWQDGRNGEWQIFFWMLDAVESSDSIQHLTDVDRPAVMVDVVSTPGQIHAFWTRLESSSQAKIIYTRRDTVAPKPPGTPVHFDLTSTPGYDDDDRVTFSWQASGSRETVEYNVYSRVDSVSSIQHPGANP